MRIISPLRGSRLWPGSDFYNHFTPSGFSSVARIRLLQSFHPFGVLSCGRIRLLQSFHPFGVLFCGLDPTSTIISPLRGSLLWPGSAYHFTTSGLGEASRQSITFERDLVRGRRTCLAKAAHRLAGLPSNGKKTPPRKPSGGPPDRFLGESSKTFVAKMCSWGLYNSRSSVIPNEDILQSNLDNWIFY